MTVQRDTARAEQIVHLVQNGHVPQINEIEQHTPLPVRMAELRKVNDHRSPMPYGPNGPVCIVDQGVYSVQFIGQSTEFTFDYLDLDHGDLWAELDVMVTSLFEIPGVRTRVNLIKGNTRRDAAKELAARYGALDYDWAGMIDIAGRWVVDQFRRGRSVIHLPDATAPETTEWLLEPLILGRRSTIWFGDGDSAKSYTALMAAASIQDNRDLFGLQPSMQANVAYLDWEWDDWEHKKRLIEMGAPDSRILYVPCHGMPLESQTDRLRRIFHEHAIKFLIIDSAAYAVNGEPESADVTMRFFRALDSFGLGSLILAHTTKNGVEDKPFGSQFWYASARLIWFARKQQDEGSPHLQLAFIAKKANTGPKPPPIAFEMDWESGSMTAKRADWRDMPQVVDKLPLQKRIMYAVRSEPKSYVELAEELDISVDTVRKIVSRFDQLFVHITRARDRVSVIGNRA